MREQLEQRLNELKGQYEHGLNVMKELETQQATLRQTMLRISGAIEVLEEALGGSAQTLGATGEEARAFAAQESAAAAG
jgi:predicted nuclease with TOPRIM domain